MAKKKILITESGSFLNLVMTLKKTMDAFF